MDGEAGPEAVRGMTGRTERLEAEGLAGPRAVARAAELLRAGGTVAFPTETVYGLGANALDAKAVEKIFVAKQRPGWDPLIVHVFGAQMVPAVALVPGEERRAVEALMKAFWPGPLTLLLPRTAAVSDAVTAGRPLVGVRMPSHPLAQELIRRAAVPIAAPSANLFGRPSPTTAAHVLEDLDGRIDAVLDGGSTSIGVESTVLDVQAMAIYRPGAVTAAMISRVLLREVHMATAGEAKATTEIAESPEGLASPGMGMRHYAPRARLLLVPTQEELLREVDGLPAGEVGVMLPDDWRPGGAEAIFRWGPWGDAEVLARLLFFGLRFLDGRGVKTIVCPVPAMSGLGEALRDRLFKAAMAK